MKVLWSTREWALAIVQMRAPGPLPARTVIVPRERAAHALRRELLRMERADVLAGTRFVTLRDAAEEVLHAAGVEFRAGEEGLRAPRLLALFASRPKLTHFPIDLVQKRPGWDGAFARTIGDLEAAGVRSEDLGSAGASPRARDIATLWRALDESAGSSWTSARILCEAARHLVSNAGLWPVSGETLACVFSDLTVVEAALLRAIPSVDLALWAARPARERHLARMGALLGGKAETALRAAVAPREGASERNILASFLFEPPPVLADEARARSDGPDGTVDLEEHAGADAEIEASADWVVRRIAEGTALEDIAVLVPSLDPLAALVAERLERIPWTGTFPVHVAGGLLLVHCAAGARALAVVRALRAHLAAEALVDVLPALRSGVADVGHLSRGAASDLVWTLGTVGGSSARPAGALDWVERMRRREAELVAQLEAAQVAEAADREWGGRRPRHLERLIRDVRAVRPGIEALCGVARLVLDGAPLGEIWPALREFLSQRLLQPGEGPPALLQLDEPLGALASDGACASLRGDEALRVIEETVGAARLGSERFGIPAVYVGTLREAIGLPFAAVRVVGLAEGHIPSVAREDPVLPDVLREGLAAAGRAAPVTAADRALGDLHALDSVVRDAGEHVALSFPRLDVERSQREPSSVLLEAAAALARPSRATGERTATIPDGATLRRDAFAPARERAASFRREHPVGETARLEAVASGEQAAPVSWRLASASGAKDGPGGAADGLLGIGAATIEVPGLDASRPISASALEKLLRCPYQFLLSQILGLEEPAEPPERREIGQPHYGSLIHEIAARFLEEHGEAFVAGERSLAAWRARIDAIAKEAFDKFLERYPLVGDAVQAQQRGRLSRDLDEFLSSDWRAAGLLRRFVAAERGFGAPEAVELKVEDRALFVRGRIDRIDVEGRRTLVRDLKSGRPYPRVGKAAALDPVRDVQIALYGLVAQQMAEAWRIPPRIAAAYSYVGPQGPQERSFRDDFHEVLEPEARRWLHAAAGLLEQRLFPRTPNQDDCRYCEFRPVCGPDAQTRARVVLGAACAEVSSGGASAEASALADYAAIKGMVGEMTGGAAGDGAASATREG